MSEPKGLEAIAAGIQALLERLPAPEVPHVDPDTIRPGSAEHRIQQLARQNKELRESLATVTEQANASVLTQVEEIKLATATELQRISGHHAEDLRLHDSGFTDALGRKTLYDWRETLPQGQQGKSPTELWGSILEQRAAHHADPEQPEPSIPKPLTPYLPALEAAEEKPAPGARARTAFGAADRGAAPAAKGVGGIDTTGMTPSDFVKALRAQES